MTTKSDSELPETPAEEKDLVGIATHALFGALHAKVKRTGETGVICYAIWSPEDENAQLFSVSIRFTDESGKTRQEEYRSYAVEISSPNSQDRP